MITYINISLIFAEAAAAESIVEDGDLPVVFVGLLALVTIIVLVILCAGDTKVEHKDKGMIILVRMNITISYSFYTNNHYTTTSISYYFNTVI